MQARPGWALPAALRRLNPGMETPNLQAMLPCRAFDAGSRPIVMEWFGNVKARADWRLRLCVAVGGASRVRLPERCDPGLRSACRGMPHGTAPPIGKG